MKNKYFVVSDVHGFYNILKKHLYEKGWEDDNPNHFLILLGDAFDRGPEVIQLFDFMKSLGDRLIYIRGNHEDLLKACYEEICNDWYISQHHVSNGTLLTINIFTKDMPRAADQEVRIKNFKAILDPVINFIDNKAVNYYELDDKIFVHGWIPCNYIGRYYKAEQYLFDPEWKKGDWEEARWINGMAAWRDGVKIDGKTIFCGHYHTYWGHEHLDGEITDERDFSPFIHDGIVALDACTVISNQINVYTFEK